MKYKFLIGLITGVLLLGRAPAVAGTSTEHCSRVSRFVTFYFGVETAVPDANHPCTVDTHHTDLETSFTASGWDIKVSWDRPGEVGGLDVEPDDALLYVNSNARISLASIPQGYEFIGATANETFWVLPQAMANGALPLGVAAEEADTAGLCIWNPGDARGADSNDRWFEARLIDVRGPEGGEFSMWQADGINPPVVFYSTFEGGVDEADVYYISAGTHIHMNWGFTRSGLYEVDMLISTVCRCDEFLTADLAPVGDGSYLGDCFVDFRDWAVLAGGWLDDFCGDPAWPCEGADIALPIEGPVDWFDIAEFMSQWLECGYPGCDPPQE